MKTRKFTLPFYFFVLVASILLGSFMVAGEAQAITVPTPALTSPGNQSNPTIPSSGEIILDWNAVTADGGAGAVERYELEVTREKIEKNGSAYQIPCKEDSEGECIVPFEPDQDVSTDTVFSPNTSFTLSNVEHGAVYRWRVRACFTDCGGFNPKSAWSAQRTFSPKFASPTIVQPPNNSTVLYGPITGMEFKWGAVSTASRYELTWAYAATGEQAVSPRQVTDVLSFPLADFNTFSFLLDESLSWKVRPLVSADHDDKIAAWRDLFPSDTIASDSFSSSPRFFVRFIPPTAPITPTQNFVVDSIPGSLFLEWDKILSSSSNTVYQVKKPGGLLDDREEFVSSDKNTLSISGSEIGGFCQVNTWEVRSCKGSTNAEGEVISSSNCGPYPSSPIVQGAYPLNLIQSGPWEFTFVPLFSITEGSLNAKRVKGELGVIQFTADWSGAEVTLITPAVPGTNGTPEIPAVFDTQAIFDFGDRETGGVPLTGSAGSISIEHEYSRSRTYDIGIGREDEGLSCAAPYENKNLLIDIDLPTVGEFDAEPRTLNTADAEFNISWDVRDTGGSGLREVQVWRTGDLGDADPISTDWYFFKTIPVSGDRDRCNNCFTDTPGRDGDGTYWYGIHVLDNFSADEDWEYTTEGELGPIKIEVRIDRLAPIVNEFNVDPRALNTADAEVNITWDVSDAGGSNLQRIEVWRRPNIDGKEEWGSLGEIIPVSGNRNSGSSTDIPGGDGIYLYGIHVVDNVGNCITEGGNHCGGTIDDSQIRVIHAPIPVTVDTRNPLPIYFYLTKDSGVSSSDRITNIPALKFRGSAKRDTSITIFRKNDEGEWVARGFLESVDGDGKWEITMPNQPEGTYSYMVENSEGVSSDPLSVTIDTTPPECSIYPESFELETDAFPGTVLLTATSSSDVYLYNWNGTEILDDPEFNFEYTKKGSHTIGLLVTDIAGNTSEERCIATVHISLPPVEGVVDPPKITDIGPRHRVVELDKPITITTSFTNASGEVKLSVRDTTDRLLCSKSASSFSSSIRCSYDVVPDGSQSQIHSVSICADNGCSGPTTVLLTFDSTPPLPGSGGGSPGFVPPVVGDPTVSATPGTCKNYCKALSGDEEFNLADERAALGNTTCICNPLSSVEFSDILGNIIDFLLKVALVVAPLTLIGAGFLFITAAGNPEQILRARTMLIWTIVGVIVILVSKGLVNVIGGILGI